MEDQKMFYTERSLLVFVVRCTWSDTAMLSGTVLEDSTWSTVKPAERHTRAPSSSSAWTHIREQVNPCSSTCGADYDIPFKRRFAVFIHQVKSENQTVSVCVFSSQLRLHAATCSLWVTACCTGTLGRCRGLASLTRTR